MEIMYIRSDKTTWQDKRIKAMNRVIEKYNSSTELFIEEYNRVCVSKAKTKNNIRERIMTILIQSMDTRVEFNQEKHVYIHNNEYVVGMSTILGKLASPMLENWKISNQVNALKDEMERQGIPLDKIDSIVTNAKANARKQGDGIF